ncbi:hypothetical protein [Pseudomonas sp. Marseille-P8916]|uniref:hypothetical protein n=1 Tax=Pseudomonas sp. Marseille-P8916 TaxID=2866589 RepID=UPI001CE45CA3|nr:hypothetical protein [Pseudomonas sp. Marseille-P8916]
MQYNANKLDTTDVAILVWAGNNLTLVEFIEVINLSIQWGPIPTLKGQLYTIPQNTVPSVAWLALIEFQDWGAGTIADGITEDGMLLIADAVLIRRVLAAIRTIMDSIDGQSGADSEAGVTLRHRPQPVPKKRPCRKFDDDAPELR